MVERIRAASSIATLTRNPAAVMASGTLVSRALGFARVAMLAAVVGVDASALGANAFDVANKLPNTVFLLVSGGAISAALIPQIVRADNDPSSARGRQAIDRLLTMYGLASLALTIGLVVAAGPLVAAYTDGWGADQHTLAVRMAVLCLPQVFFYGLFAVLGQILNAREVYGPFMWAPAANNVIALLGLTAFYLISGSASGLAPDRWSTTQVVVLAGSATLGVAIQALILIGPLRQAGFQYRFKFGLRGIGLRRVGPVAAWSFGAVVFTQVAFIVLSRTAAAAGSASVVDGIASDAASNAAWSFAFLLFMLPHGLIAVSLVTATFTRVSQLATQGDLPQAGLLTHRRLQSLLPVMGLASVLLAVLARPAMTLIGSSGQASPVADVVATMAAGLTAFSGMYLLQRFFYALDDGRTPFIVQALSSTAWVAAMFVIPHVVEARGVVPSVALARAGVHVAAFVALLVLTHKRVPTVQAGPVAVTFVKTMAAAGLVYLIANRLPADWLQPEAPAPLESLALLTVGGIAVTGLYVALAWAAGLIDVAALRGWLKRQSV